MSTQDAAASLDLAPTQEVHLSEVEEEEAEEDTAEDLPRARWEGSDVLSAEIQWLYDSRQIPKDVEWRRPGSEITPEPQSGEYVVFLSHFERGFGLPTSHFMSQFLVRFGLQPHHLPANAFVSLSSFVAFVEGYLGLWPSVDLWTKFFVFRRQVLPNTKKTSSAEREMTQCGAATINPRRGSILPRVKGLDSCKMWQKTFFYVRNTTAENLIGLPAFVIGPLTQLN